MKIIFRTFDLELKHTFTISRRSYATQPTLIIELQSEGYSGFGEATANEYYNTTVDSMKQNLEQIKGFIENSNSNSYRDETPEEFWKKAYLLFLIQWLLCAQGQAQNAVGHLHVWVSPTFAWVRAGGVVLQPAYDIPQPYHFKLPVGIHRTC